MNRSPKSSTRENEQALSSERAATMTLRTYAMQQPLAEPTAVIPTPAMSTHAGSAGAGGNGALGGQLPSQGGRNTLALVSLIASLLFPVAIGITVLAPMAQANHLIPQRAMTIFVMIGAAVGALGLPTMLSALVTGHIALIMAKRFSRHGARRWMAIVGLVIGYLSLLTFFGVIALFLLPPGTKVQLF
jgi:hypothetical protein